MALTGNAEMDVIVTNSQRIFTFSWSFFVLIITSAYTANLASFLVNATNAKFSVNSIKAATEAGIPLCTFRGAFTEASIRSKYPGINLQSAPIAGGIYTELNSEKCDLLADTAGNWAGRQRDASVNLGCNLEWNGIVQHSNYAGLMMKCMSSCSRFLLLLSHFPFFPFAIFYPFLSPTSHHQCHHSQPPVQFNTSVAGGIPYRAH